MCGFGLAEVQTLLFSMHLNCSLTLLAHFANFHKHFWVFYKSSHPVQNSARKQITTEVHATNIKCNCLESPIHTYIQDDALMTAAISACHSHNYRHENLASDT